MREGKWDVTAAYLERADHRRGILPNGIELVVHKGKVVGYFDIKNKDGILCAIYAKAHQKTVPEWVAERKDHLSYVEIYKPNVGEAPLRTTDLPGAGS